MAKMKKDGRTLDLLSWQPPEVTQEFKKCDVKAASANGKYAKAVALTLNECAKSRDEIADLMSDYLDEAITKNMLDAYASEGRASHMISLPRLEALIAVTGDSRLLALIAKMFDLIVVDGCFAHLIKAVQLKDKVAEFEALEKSHRAKFKRDVAGKGFDL